MKQKGWRTNLDRVDAYQSGSDLSLVINTFYLPGAFQANVIRSPLSTLIYFNLLSCTPFRCSAFSYIRLFDLRYIVYRGNCPDGSGTSFWGWRLGRGGGWRYALKQAGTLSAI